MRAALLVTLAACVNLADQYKCTPGADTTCVAADGTQGQCEPTGNCAFPDNTCGDGGARYDATAQPGRAGVCELASTGATMTAPQPVGASQPLPFEIAFGAPQVPQMLVVDTAGPGTAAEDVALHWFAGACPPTGPEQQVQLQACMAPGAVRLVVGIPAAGVYCILATADAGQISLRVFPQAGSSTPGC